MNPLTFNVNQPTAKPAANLGALPETGGRLISHLVGAQSKHGFLWIPHVDVPGFPDEEGDYHESDFLLFYLNIRKNAATRLENF